MALLSSMYRAGFFLFVPFAALEPTQHTVALMLPAKHVNSYIESRQLSCFLLVLVMNQGKKNLQKC